MDLNSGFYDYVDQEQLLFGIEGIRGDEELPGLDSSYDYGMNSNISHRLASYPDCSTYSTSPDFHLIQTQSLPVHVHVHECAPVVSPTWSSSEIPSHHSFTEGFGHHVSGPSNFYDYPGWNSPETFQNSPNNAFSSSPVDIPKLNHSEMKFQHLNVAAGTGATSFLSNNSSWGNSFPSMSRTESVASYDTSTTIEETIPFPSLTEPNQLNPEHMSVSSFQTIQYRHDGRTNRLAPGTGPGSRRPRGRTGPLNEAQRRATARMREIKACQSCRERKAKCDAGIPCKQCINYYKSNLIHHPCRGLSLEHIADKLLKGHIFPRRRTLGQYLGPNFSIWPETFNVYLELGFGEPFAWPAQVVSPYKYGSFANELRHEHVVYDWPHDHSFATERTVQKQYVFPAVLANTGDLKAAVDTHLTKQVNNPANFVHFPLYNSPLKVLKHIYEFYYQLGNTGEDKQAKSLLGQAFKLLNLIHIGGDTRISSNPDSRWVLDHFFAPHVQECDTSPCFIRGQLGDVFSKLSLEYMKEVLSKLEIECLNKNCRRFPLIVSTFMVLFMAVESIQYHTHKDTFHIAFDGGETSQGPSKDEIDGMMDLLEFYKNCFAGCHRDRLLSPTDNLFWGENPNGSTRAGELALQKLRGSVQVAREYLARRSKESLSSRNGDITVFFDRLVAKLVLLED